ncbi:hypothetical protein M0R45_026199 [Rubus argutus]|uniref:Uncharacterized protein n=1 Tax=Rubus argutus TaxID=59490 RepID=A0AAW1WY83_RUBAR
MKATGESRRKKNCCVAVTVPSYTQICRSEKKRRRTKSKKNQNPTCPARDNPSRRRRGCFRLFPSPASLLLRARLSLPRPDAVVAQPCPQATQPVLVPRPPSLPSWSLCRRRPLRRHSPHGLFNPQPLLPPRPLSSPLFDLSKQ